MALTRETAAPQHITVGKLADDVAYIRVPAMEAGAAGELRDKLTHIEPMGLHKVVLDLRDCSSGPVAEGIDAAKLFVPSGTLAVLSGQTVSRQQFDASADKVVWRGPLEVLINDGSSGAAEVLAGALAGNHRADLVGGFASLPAPPPSRSLHPDLEDGSALFLTVAYYYTPANKAILTDGVMPTVPVAEPQPDVTSTDQEEPAPLKFGQLPVVTDSAVHKALDLFQNPPARKAA